MPSLLELNRTIYLGVLEEHPVVRGCRHSLIHVLRHLFDQLRDGADAADIVFKCTCAPIASKRRRRDDMVLDLTLPACLMPKVPCACLSCLLARSVPFRSMRNAPSSQVPPTPFDDMAKLHDSLKSCVSRVLLARFRTTLDGMPFESEFIDYSLQQLVDAFPHLQHESEGSASATSEGSASAAAGQWTFELLSLPKTLLLRSGGEESGGYSALPWTTNM